MLNIEDKVTITEYESERHRLKVFELQDEYFDDIVAGLVEGLPNHYAPPAAIADTLERLGKAAAANKLRIKIPQSTKIRSGDIGEVLATDYIEDYTDYQVPIRKLRWRDHRDMAMRGDDVIGLLVNTENQTIRFLKTEAKANKALSTDVLSAARKELDLDDGLPAPHALQFVSDRLREIGNTDLADLIEKVSLVDGIHSNQVEHLLFTFTASNPNSLQKTAFDAYAGPIKQSSVGLRVKQHQELVSSVYQEILNGLND